MTRRSIIASIAVLTVAAFVACARASSVPRAQPPAAPSSVIADAGAGVSTSPPDAAAPRTVFSIAAVGTNKIANVAFGGPLVVATGVAFAVLGDDGQLHYDPTWMRGLSATPNGALVIDHAGGVWPDTAWMTLSLWLPADRLDGGTFERRGDRWVRVPAATHAETPPKGAALCTGASRRFPDGSLFRIGARCPAATAQAEAEAEARALRALQVERFSPTGAVVTDTLSLPDGYEPSIPSDDPEFGEDFFVVGNAPDHVYALATLNNVQTDPMRHTFKPRVLLARFDGASWTTIPTPFAPESMVDSAALADDGTLYAVIDTLVTRAKVASAAHDLRLYRLSTRDDAPAADRAWREVPLATADKDYVPVHVWTRGNEPWVIGKDASEDHWYVLRTAPVATPVTLPSWADESAALDELADGGTRPR